EAERSGIEAALDGMNARRARHVLADDFEDPARSLRYADLQRLGDVLSDRRLGKIHIELHLAAEEIARIEITGHQIGVGDGGFVAAERVACRPRRGPRAFRPHLEQPHAVYPRDAATARPDLDQLH